MELNHHNILIKIKEKFHLNVKHADENFNHKGDRNQYYKWVAGWGLAQENGWGVTAVRNMCREMEKQGLLHSVKRSGAVLWACQIDGYSQHQIYGDYYYRVQGTCSQESCQPLFTGCNVEGESHICKCIYFTQSNQGDAIKK